MGPITHQPFAYELGPIPLSGFGLAMLMSFVMAQYVAQRELARRGHDPEPLADIVVAAVIGGLLGAKLYYVALTGDPRALLNRAGFVFWGGLLGGIGATWGWMRFKRIPFTRVSDVAAPAIAAAYAIGRTGCWAVGDDYGRPWDGPLAVLFPQGAPPSTAAVMTQAFGVIFPPGTPPDQVIAVHPTQLYEVAMGMAMFAILWRMRDHRHAEGWLFGWYCVLAGVERFVVEFFRAKDDRFVAGLTVAQVIALAFAVGGLLWVRARRDVRAGAPGIHAAA
jgi:phosphatidylglycerol:prolipoprotein diacylglycerol transferase